jgi:quercetin dioxygenase-like cupin family protein
MMAASNAGRRPDDQADLRGAGRFLVSIGEGAEVLLGGLAVQFKLRAGHTGGQLSITETTLGPHRLVPPHIHADEDEFAYVAAGTIGVRVGDDEFEAAQGSYLIKPRGVTHAFWNPVEEPARTVEVIVPAGFEAFFEELAQASAAGDARQVQQRRADLAVKYRLGYPAGLIPELKAKHGLKLIGE